MLYLGRIEPVKYKNFISLKFKAGGLKLSGEIIDLILEKTRNLTYYVQYLCNQLYASGYASINYEVTEVYGVIF